MARPLTGNICADEFDFYESSCMRFGAMSLPNRIKKIRLSLGLDQAEYGELLGYSQATVSRWENPEAAQEPGKRALSKIAKSGGISIDELIEDSDLFSSQIGKIKLVGFIGVGAAVHHFADGQEHNEVVDGFYGATPETVAVEVRGDCLGENFDQWLAYYGAIKLEVPPDFIGRLCVVWLDDGRVLVRKIMPGQIQGTFNLLANYGPPIYDARIVSAAKVIHMAPRE